MWQNCTSKRLGGFSVPRSFLSKDDILDLVRNLHTRIYLDNLIYVATLYIWLTDTSTNEVSTVAPGLTLWVKRRIFSVSRGGSDIGLGPVSGLKFLYTELRSLQRNSARTPARSLPRRKLSDSRTSWIIRLLRIEKR
jgi:hypothetical protein